MGFELILPFLQPIEHLILDEGISEIMVNGSGRIFIERAGDLREVPDAHLTEKNLQVAVRNIARALGDEVNEQQPLLDSRLPDGSRVAAVIPPCSIGGTTLTIRKFHSKQFTADELVRIGSLTAEVLGILRAAILERHNILISGGTGTGKTTLLNALASFIPEVERIVLIEDTAEIPLEKPNLVRFEARREQPELPAVTIRDLVRASLRHRPDRILLGEVRGGEAFDLLQALNTGHSGSSRRSMPTPPSRLSRGLRVACSRPAWNYPTRPSAPTLRTPSSSSSTSSGAMASAIPGNSSGSNAMTPPRTDTNLTWSTPGRKSREPMDPDVPVQYIRENFRGDDRVAVVLIHKETRRAIQRVATADRIAQPHFQARLRHENASRFEVYIGMNPVRETSHSRTKADIAAVRHVYLDFDDNGSSAVQALLRRSDVPEPNYLVNTSSDRWQVVWKVEGFGIEDAERLMRHMARETGADPAATDSSRVLRLPGFLSHKHGAPFLVRAQSGATQTYTPDHFPKYPLEEQSARALIDRSESPPQPRRVGHLSQSERDWAYAKRALARGDQPAKVIAAIAQFRAGEKTDVQAYATRTVHKAIKVLEADRASTRSDMTR
jgi:pilus assembly protein CpaF